MRIALVNKFPKRYYLLPLSLSLFSSFLLYYPTKEIKVCNNKEHGTSYNLWHLCCLSSFLSSGRTFIFFTLLFLYRNNLQRRGLQLGLFLLLLWFRCSALVLLLLLLLLLLLSKFLHKNFLFSSSKKPQQNQP